MKAEIITIGDELMSGDVINTNFSWLAQRLWNAGFEVTWQSSCADRPEHMSEAFRRALRSDVVIVTGGLGPTSDDRTLQVAAETFDKEMVLADDALVAIKDRLGRIGREMNEAQRKQAYHPAGGVMFANLKGTAPGCRLEVDGTHFIFLVGVPSEMHEQWEREVWPFLQSIQDKPLAFQQKIYRCFGAPEAELEMALKNFSVPQLRLSYRLKFPEVLIKLACWADTVAEVNTAMAQGHELLLKQIGQHVYANDDETIEKLVGRLLQERGETVALAESCTGGYIANLMTDVAGASHYFKQGLVTYSNEAKQDLLGVKADTLEAEGAVSEAVALEMAAGVRERAGTTYGIGVTGIAGPDGGTEEKPVGTVHVALATPGGVKAKAYHFPYGRMYFKQTVTAVALHKLRRQLIKAE